MTPVITASIPPISYSRLPTVADVIVPATASRQEAEPFSRRQDMKKVLIKVPNGGNLLKKLGQDDVWLNH